MITSLFIKDYALINELRVEFKPGLSILTGQTGAGKSIIIGALNLILGERAETEFIRQHAEKAIAEATFNIDLSPRLLSIFDEFEIEKHTDLILRRELRAGGSRAFVNDTPVPVHVLKSIGDELVDLHGQHDHQLLLKEENHLWMLDSFSEKPDVLETYHTEWKTLAGLRTQYAATLKASEALAEKMELYRFQSSELTQLELREEEEEELLAEMKILDSTEDVYRLCGFISETTRDEEAGLLVLIQKLAAAFENLTEISPEFAPYAEEIRSARLSIKDAVDFSEKYQSRVEFNPARLENLRNRYTKLQQIQKKYGKTIPELISYHLDIKEKLSRSDSFDSDLEALNEQITRQMPILAAKAEVLHTERIQSAKKLGEQLKKELSEMGIPSARFEAEIEWLADPDGWIKIEGKNVNCTENGCDSVRFLLSTNKGEHPKPLAKIASGGEISRVMLALKAILMQKEHLPVMVFDEIDTGISGSVSEMVGKKMRLLSAHAQIIAITHQPQIAGQAHHHYRVQKSESGDRTLTKIIPLNHEEHIREVASLMSGETISEAALQSARHLIEQHQKDL